MRKIFSLVFALSIFGGSIFGGAFFASGPAHAAAPAPKTKSPLSTALPAGVTVARDVVYATIPGFRPLTLDIYQPPLTHEMANAKAKGAQPGLHPLVVFIHGGDWNSGTAREAGTFADFPAVLASIAARGYVVASINYRLSGEARFPAALMDAKAAIRWLRNHAADYRIDQTRVIAWGASAGGQIAALLGTTCGVASLEPILPPGAADANSMPSDCVQGVIDWYGVTDLATLGQDSGRAPLSPGAMSPEGAYLGCEPDACAPGLVRTASPTSYVEAMDPPFLIQHGEIDTTVPVSQSQKLYDSLRAGGIPAELVIYPKVAHDFAKVPFAPDPDTNKLVLERVVAFLAHVAPPTDTIKPQQAMRSPVSQALKKSAAPRKP